MADDPATRDSPELVEAVARARAAWPQLPVDEGLLTAWLRDRADDRVPVAKLHAGDLLLACACAQGDPSALAAFHAQLDAGLAGVLARASRRGVDPQELRQQLAVHLFVAEPDGVPRIAEYRGAGSLRTWVRVVATRLLLNAGRRKSAHDDPLTDRVEFEIAGAGDLELDWLKEHYRTAFREALRSALVELPAADRSLLRLCVVSGLSATGVAAIYRVHRATAKRWIARVRASVLEATRDHLHASLRVDPAELDSIIGLIGSRLDASVRRCLVEDAGDVG